MKHSILPTTLVASFLASPLTISAETVYSDPVGYVSITCPANADTIVGVPLRQTASFSGATSEDPEVDGTDVSIVTLTFDTTFSTDYASAYYVLFTSGLSEGKFYEITESDTTTLTIDLNGDT
ncbi:MAG: TIGR02597 family protein, partial [Luteolibacter sp.]